MSTRRDHGQVIVITIDSSRSRPGHRDHDHGRVIVIKLDSS
ncbi:hypothetical protein A7982_12447 [Minicystis rosea]|nr:hypothetical protein A7982_12447 [Minicystis rosea]